MAFVLDRKRSTFGQADVISAETAAIAASGASANTSISLLTYYLMAVAAGVTVYLITTRLLGRKG